MRVVDFSLRRPVTVFIFAMAAVVFGVVAFRQLAVDLLPDITYPSLTVQTRYQGAAPAEIESLVTKPLENAVGVVNSVVRVLSSSRPDVSEVTLEFQWGTDMDFASLDVRERLDVVRLPVGVERPVLLRYDPSLDPVLRLGLTGGTDLIRLRRIADEEVKRALERVEGVAAAIVSGGLEEEIQVELDDRQIGSLGLDVQVVVNRLAQENVNLTGGRLREGQTEYLVRTINELLRPEDLRQIVVQRSPTGVVTRLGDVARVVKGSKEREIITRIDGRESVEVAIYKEGGTNTVTVVDAVREALAGVTARLAAIEPTLEITQLTDQARYIRESIAAVVSSALLGGGLAILVLFLFLRSLKNTLIIGIAIPISVMATFFLMYVAGISLNIMSLGGLTLGIGLLLDNSIVVLEAIQRKREEGLGVVEAARVGASEVSRAVTASTITTVCVFVPIVFVEGVAGQLFGDQALTVTFSLIVSLAVALTLIPMFASRTFSVADEPEGAAARASSVTGRWAPLRWLERLAFGVALGVARAGKRTARGLAAAGRTVLAPILGGFDRALGATAAAYQHLLAGALARPSVAFAVAIALLGLSAPLVSRLGVELVPELVQGEFFVDVELLPGTRLEVTDRRLQEVAAGGAGLGGVDRVFTVAGASNEQGGSAGERRENIGQLTVKLHPPISRDNEERVIAELRSLIDGANTVYADAGGGVESEPRGSAPQLAGLTAKQRGALDYRFGRPSYFSFRTPIEVEIRGFNLGLLQRLAADLVARMRGIEGLVDVKSSTEGGNPELQIVFDRARLAALGYSVGELGNVVRSKVQGEVATDIQREDRSIDIRLRADERYRDSVRDLRNLNVARTGRTPIPLGSVAELIETEGPAEIRRANGSRVALITANLVGRDLGSVAADIESTLRGMTFPSGFDWRIGGQRQEMETSFASMRLAILLAVFMVYLVMASQFESLLHPFVILFSVPFSVVGAILALWATGTTVSIVVLIGAILLAGIVVNNAIILVDYTNNLRREGRSKLEALVAAGRVRLRPILMTTSTTVLGLLPMALGLGEGSELRAPMALTVVGGLITSTVLTLLLIPVVYRVLDRRP
ncbi:MAG TPA: efflux RND transporter permease subunit [Thermoanaerobaculia bacterium]|nr:efflux RND transporter permease subunit [Thermoanaerobaculia bacterium]